MIFIILYLTIISKTAKTSKACSPSCFLKSKFYLPKRSKASQDYLKYGIYRQLNTT